MHPLFQPAEIAGLELKNRWVMAPMTRSKSPGGIPSEDMAEYYAMRAAGGIGLIISEGVLVEHPLANAYQDVPYIKEETVQSWRRINQAVHAHQTKIFAQLWHCGPEANPGIGAVEEVRSDDYITRAATAKDRSEIIAAFADGAYHASQAGFDGVELHAAHGYLLDSFIRAGELDFMVDLIKSVRANLASNHKLCLRFSPWRVNDLEADYIKTPQRLESILQPLSEAGVDIFHASLRRHWVSPFGEEDDLSLAGWTRKITGKPTITVGNIGLVTQEFKAASGCASFAELKRRFDAGHFDLAAVARPLITQADWVEQIQAENYDAITEFFPQAQAKVWP